MKTDSRKYPLVIDTPVGSIGVQLQDVHVTRIDFLARRRAEVQPDDHFASFVNNELMAWFADPKFEFTVPVQLQGTAFQQRVWLALCEIRSGETLTYGELASELGSGARAVGNACRRNPVSLIVPCHRVVGVNGMGGYGGLTGDRSIWRKHWLLSHEGARCAGLKSLRQPQRNSDTDYKHGAIHA